MTQFDMMMTELGRAVAKVPQAERDRYMMAQVEEGRFALVVACDHCKEPYDPECSDDYDVVCRAHCERPHFDVHRGET